MYTRRASRLRGEVYLAQGGFGRAVVRIGARQEAYLLYQSLISSGITLVVGNDAIMQVFRAMLEISIGAK
jgi:hypothetical protein